MDEFYLCFRDGNNDVHFSALSMLLFLPAEKHSGFCFDIRFNYMGKTGRFGFPRCYFSRLSLAPVSEKQISPREQGAGYISKTGTYTVRSNLGRNNSVVLCDEPNPL